MGCPPVRGDNPRALASGLSYVQVDKHCITIYTTYTSVDIAHYEIVHAKVGKGDINYYYFIKDELNSWIGNRQSVRTQAVVLEGKKSEPVNLDSGRSPFKSMSVC